MGSSIPLNGSLCPSKPKLRHDPLIATCAGANCDQLLTLLRRPHGYHLDGIGPSSGKARLRVAEKTLPPQRSAQELFVIFVPALVMLALVVFAQKLAKDGDA